MINPYEAYLESNISTASKLDQIIMLYDKAIISLERAKEDIKNNDIKSKINNINKALDIINYLNAILDMEKGEEIAQNLRDIYTFLMKHITIANAENSVEKIDESIKVLKNLNEGWIGIKDKI
ncbi:flagellar export chaperone FliS [Venenivibrio stagnispumantis]|uniref:Flagellar protein FliS n=1 Tax=Venenivibrio stagnispumantis TaxID=407998 RepID=A0AA46ACJ6_9AQUI|nr:flagellar export chaperone FliS [Venenivibrio stagnispumantis]MCW4572741.1 flagellar export chaperone FliS [Venenivibrio stagnispumantis]SMP00232.1 flagellar protein FliS [Venenivibrio stagnispumantis]